MEKMLKDMLDKQPYELSGKTKKLFEAIMKIADERDRLQKENEELSRLNEKLEMEYNILLNAKVAIDIGSTESVGIEFLEEYIPKSVIQDKIKELKLKLGKTYNLYGANDYEFIKLEAKIQILEEILKGE